MKKISNKLLNSIHFEYLIQSVKNGKETAEIYRELNEDKQYPISLPTVRDAVKFVKKNGDKAVELLAASRQEIVEISNNIKEIAPTLTDTLKRRTLLLKEILYRKEELIKAQKEGDRVDKLRKQLQEFKELYLTTDDKSLIEQQLRNIDAFIVSNFANYMFKTSIENLIRQYIMDSHEIFKYCENWISKYDIFNLVEKVVTKVAESSMLVFGNYIKRESPEKREEIILKFKEAVERTLREVREEELKLGDESEYDQEKYK